MPRFIDISIGCGGSSLGLSKAGCDLMFAITDQKHCKETIEKNKSKWDVVIADIMMLDFSEYADDGIDLIIGTIPYNIYSVNSMVDILAKKAQRSKKYKSDKEKEVYIKLCEKIGIDVVEDQERKTRVAKFDVIKELVNEEIAENKKIIVKENKYTHQSKHLFAMFRVVVECDASMFMFDAVPSILRHDNGRTFECIIEYANTIGYKTMHKILDAWEYGVPQKRKRLIIIGIKHNIYKSQKRLGNVFHFPVPIDESLRTTLRDAIGDLDEENPEISDYSAEKKKILAQVPPGGCWINLPIDVQKKYLGKIPDPIKGGQRGIARRLKWDEPCLTLTTSPNQKQTDRCHPDETRPLTVHEYSRIQSFPKHWKYAGSIAKKYTQIGQSLPPLLVKCIGDSIVKYFEKMELSDIE
jgi:DNA (cytosine-5)-methyltransferase 1